MKQRTKLTVGILFFLSLILLFTWQVYSPKNISDTKNELFLIEKGQGFLQISSDLEKKGIIKNDFWLNFYVILKISQSKLQAGEYFLNPSMNIAEIANKIISGNTARVVITIPEGWNLRDMGWYFEGKGMFQAEELFELVGFPLIDYSKNTDLPKPKDFGKEFTFLEDKPKSVSLEGYFFPDTYYLQRLESLESVARKMLENFDNKLTQELREEIGKQEKSIFEIITMASLIEKEVRGFEDKKIVSGILWKRLKNSVPLQVDATIIYITGKNTTKVSIKETQINSPYNTYKYRGLPLGPICNPGLESIQASVYPKSSQYWYYLSTPEGKTIFSKTLEEHNIAKAKYLK